MESKGPSHASCSGDGAPLVERNRYYTGKFMTARDFQGEQDYLRSRAQLHNRLLHGWGIVCGLDVLEHPLADCRSSNVIVKAGFAMDCWGRELVLAEDVVFPCPRNSTAPNPPEPAEAPGPEQREEWLLCLYYGEQMIELMPPIYGTGAGDLAEEANRVREAPELRLVRLYEVEPGCWQGGAKAASALDDCSDPLPSPANSLLKPVCPCGAGVPLALLTFHRDRNNDPVQIETNGRRHLPINADQLTHLIRTNWRHGETMTLHHLRGKLGGRLEIEFDRKLLPTPENLSTGVSEFTFIAHFGGVHRDVRHLPYIPDSPPSLDPENSRLAVYPIDRVYLDLAQQDDLRDKVVYITLKCDFILDCRKLPVDGSFLGAKLPTHSGRMGGTFESWFFIAGAADNENAGPDRVPAHRRLRRGGERV